MELNTKTFNSLYFDEQLSIRVVAKRLGVNHENLRYFVKKNKIKLRSKSEATVISYKEQRRNTSGENNPNYKHGRLIDAGFGKRWSKYGITKDEFQNMVIEQNNKCCICDNEFDKTPHIDHCHETGRVRGLLCGFCNTGIGLFKHNPKLLKKAMKYIIGTKARWGNN